MQQQLSQRLNFSVAVRVESLDLCAPRRQDKNRMSVLAFDQLLLSVAGKPSLAAAAKKREFLLDGHHAKTKNKPHASTAASSATGWTLDRDHHAVPFHQRFLFHGKLRKRMHSAAHKPQALWLRLYGLKKTGGWPRTLLAAFRVDVVDHLGGLHATLSSSSSSLSARGLNASTTVELLATGGLCSDSKVRLFFDGLLLHASGKTEAARTSRFPWRLPSPVKLLGRSRAPTLQSTAAAAAVFDGSSAVFHPSVGIPVDRQIELVRWRRRSSRSLSISPRRRHSVNGRARRPSTHKSREASASAADEGLAVSTEQLNEEDDEEEEQEQEEEEETDFARVDAAIDAAKANARRLVAAEANAQLSFELMERKASNNTHYAATTRAAAWSSSGADPVDLHVAAVHSSTSSQSAPQEEATPAKKQSPADEIERLRAENAEQKALIRQLLIENRRLLAQQQPEPIASKRRKHLDSQSTNTAEEDEDDDRGRGESTASTVSSASLTVSRRASLSFDVVDGRETLVDHEFDHLVSEIESELAELLSEDGFFPQQQQQQQQQYQYNNKTHYAYASVGPEHEC